VSRITWSRYLLCLIWLVAVSIGLPLNPIVYADTIVDNSDSGIVSTGLWKVSGGYNPYEPGDPSANSMWARGGDDTFTFPFTPQQSGMYEVWEWHSEWSTRTSAAPHQISHADGTTNYVVNQQMNAGDWNSMGVYRFVANETYYVRVTSATGTSSTCADAMRWSPVTAGNVLPTATIQSIAPNPAIEGDTVTFTGVGSDSDGSVVNYRWSEGAVVLSTSASFSTSTLAVGSHTITFEVQDDADDWSAPDSETVVIQAVGVNAPPTASIDSIAPNPATEGDTVIFAGSGSDSDGSVVNYRWSEGAVVLSTSASFSTSTLAVGSHTITFEVQDDADDWSAPDSETVVIQAVGANEPPTATIQSITPNPAYDGEMVTCTGSGSDADGTVVSYRWSEGTDVLSTSASFSTSSMALGDHTLTFEVQDDDGDWSAPAIQLLTIIEPPLEIIRDNSDTGPTETSRTGEWEVSGGANPFDPDDPDRNSLWARGGNDEFFWYFTAPQTGDYEVWEWHSQWTSRTSAAPFEISHADGTTDYPVNQQMNAGDWNSMGIFPFVAGETYYVKVTSVNDSSSTCADAVKWSLVAPGNDPPTATIDSIAPNPATEGDTVIFAGSGSDTDGTVVSYRWSEGTDVLSTSASFFTNSLAIGTHTISFEVQDDAGNWSAPATQSLVIQAVAANQPPTATIQDIFPNPATDGNTVTFTGSGSDTDGTVDNFRWTSGTTLLSNSASFSTSTLEVGTHTITFEVQDDDGDWSAPDSETLVVQVFGANNPPTATIQSITPNPAYYGEMITCTGTGSDTDGTVVSYRWSAGGVVMSTSALFTTDSMPVGDHTISFEVQDDDGDWSAPATQLLTISTPPLEIIRDNSDTGPSETSRTGEWEVSGGANPFDPDDPDRNSLWARGGNDEFFWYFTAPQTGTYEVWEWHSQWSSRTTAAPFEISHASGTTDYTVNQQMNAGDWNSLGIFPFVAGETYYVKVTSVNDSSSTCADAVKWSLFSGEIPPLAIIDDISPNPANEGQPINFAGHGSDTDGGSITHYRWTSSINGILSFSDTFYTVDLSPGTHTIGFEVRDDEGNWSVPSTMDIRVDAISAQEEHIYYCMGYGSGRNPLSDAERWLENRGAQKVNGLWHFTNSANKTYIWHFVEDIDGMRQALMTRGAHVIYRGHANYGIGALFATWEERVNAVVEDLYTIDDPRILNISSPWINVNVRGIRTSQAFPNWWPEFQDGTSGIMPYSYGETAGVAPHYYDTPPFNYYMTYQMDGDPTNTHYLAQSANFGAIERFPDSRTPAWYSADGSPPNPNIAEHQQYFITNDEPWAPSLEVRGDWTSSYDLPDFFRDDYLRRPAGTGSSEVEYHFTIIEPGEYKISGWWPESPDHTTAARYTIHHGPGATSTIYLADQTTNGGQWNELGQYPFESGDYSVVISDQTDAGVVVADGIRVEASVNPPAVIQADFNAPTRYGPAPLVVTFDSESTGDITSILWDLGDGFTNTTRTTLEHTYTSPGTYTVTYTVTGPAGTSTVTRPGYIIVGDNVEPPLKAEFSGNRQAGIVPLESSFRDRSSGDIVAWSWDFNGDGIEDSNEPSPAYTYTEPGNYTVSLTVTDSNNVTSTEEKPNFVLARLYDISLDNVDYPKVHYGSKTILFRKDLEVPKDELRYKRLFYESCNTGNYYLTTFNHGIVFYTVNLSGALGFWTYIENYMYGRSNEEILQRMLDRDPVYDYYDFNKLPSQQ
jgi:PKD repeat protein